MERIRLLFLAANPKVSSLRLDVENREITAKIRATTYRDSLEVISKLAVTPDDLQQALLEHRPHILHFSGHGTQFEELELLDSSGDSKPVSNKAITDLLRVLKDNLRLVVLNACFSQTQAHAITQVIDCAIGMDREIGDDAAIKFAGAFYRAIGFGRSIQTAFDLGRSSLLLEGIPEENKPKLMCRSGVDPTKVVLGYTSERVAADLGTCAQETSEVGAGKVLTPYTVGCYNYPPFSKWKTKRSSSFKPDALTREGAKHFGGPWFQLMEGLATRLDMCFSFGMMTSVALTQLEAWNYDFIPGVFRTRARERLFDFSIPVHRIGLQGVCKAGRRFTKGELQKRKCRIIVQPGEVGWEYVKAEFPSLFESGRVFQVTSEQTTDAMNLLVSGEYDLAIGDEISCINFVRDERWAGEFVLAFADRLQIFDAGIAVRKSLNFDLSRLNDAICQERSTLEFRRIEANALRGFEHIELCSVRC